MKSFLLNFILLFILADLTSAQTVNSGFKKIYSFALDGEIKKALEYLESTDKDSLTEKEKFFKTEFELRFKGESDESNFLLEKNSSIYELILIYRDYWRNSFLNQSVNSDSILIQKLAGFFEINISGNADSVGSSLEGQIDASLKKYISDKNLKTTGFGKTGKFYDLLVWKTESDTNFSFNLKDETIKCKVVFMDDFITLGWEEYSTIGKYYPGGWATRDALYCVRKAYDIKSENFLISYLAHEGRHFEDYKLFPKLSGADLEYRAKLTELSLLNETLINVIEHFITNSNYESDNAHSIANYCVIRDMSGKIFGNEFESKISRWKSVKTDSIHESAYSLFNENTSMLKKEGADVEKFIKK